VDHRYNEALKYLSTKVAGTLQYASDIYPVKKVTVWWYGPVEQLEPEFPHNRDQDKKLVLKNEQGESNSVRSEMEETE
jgi:hypothetical protein